MTHGLPSAAALPDDGNQSAWQRMQPKGIRYEDPEEMDLFKSLTRSDLVFTGRMDKIERAYVPVVQAAVPLKLLRFSEIDVYKGTQPASVAFRCAESIQEITIPEGAKVLVGLRKTGKTDSYEIISLNRATAKNVSLARSLKR